MTDSKAFQTFNKYGKNKAVLMCDHGGNFIPESYQNLGLKSADLYSHIALDIGAAKISEYISNYLDIPSIISKYSRLFIDLNRFPESHNSIPSSSDEIIIPGNQNISSEERKNRFDVSFYPYHKNAVIMFNYAEKLFNQVAYISIHTFTPFFNKKRRPWDIGILYANNDIMAKNFISKLDRNKYINIGLNKPYSAIEPKGYGYEIYGFQANRPNLILEIRQDLVSTEYGISKWSNYICKALEEVLNNSNLFNMDYNSDTKSIE